MQPLPVRSVTRSAKWNDERYYGRARKFGKIISKKSKKGIDYFLESSNISEC